MNWKWYQLVLIVSTQVLAIEETRFKIQNQIHLQYFDHNVAMGSTSPGNCGLNQYSVVNAFGVMSHYNNLRIVPALIAFAWGLCVATS